MYIFAGDVGGTHTRLCICKSIENGDEICAEHIFHSREYDSFYEILDQFISSNNQFEVSDTHVCFAVAGPCIEGKARITNLPWIIDEQFIKDTYGFSSVKLVNDFYALGHSLDELSENDITTLQTGKAKVGGTKLVFGAGTGLGMCIVLTVGGDVIVLPSEFGNSSFAPCDTLSAEFTLDRINSGNSLVYDDVLSGPGLVNIYSFISDSLNQPFSPMDKLDTAPLISKAAIMDNHAIAVQALNLFVKIYANVARNLALTTLPSSGIYIAGGIAPQVMKKEYIELFIKEFSNSKKMKHILNDIPLHIIKNTKAGLIGAIEIAKQFN